MKSKTRNGGLLLLPKSRITNVLLIFISVLIVQFLLFFSVNSAEAVSPIQEQSIVAAINLPTVPLLANEASECKSGDYKKVQFSNLTAAQLATLNAGGTVTNFDTGIVDKGVPLLVTISSSPATGGPQIENPPTPSNTDPSDTTVQAGTISSNEATDPNAIKVLVDDDGVGLTLSFQFSVNRPAFIDSATTFEVTGNDSGREYVVVTADSILQGTRDAFRLGGADNNSGQSQTTIKLQGRRKLGDGYRFSTADASGTPLETMNLDWQYYSYNSITGEKHTRQKFFVEVCPYETVPAVYEIEKSVGPESVTAGEPVAYSYVITNTSSEESGIVDFIDLMPADGRVYLDGTVMISSSTGTAPAGYTENSYGGTNELTIDTLTLAALEVVTITVVVDVPISIDGLPPAPTTAMYDNEAAITDPDTGTEHATSTASFEAVAPTFAPVANDDFAQTCCDESKSIPVLLNDYDPDFASLSERAEPTEYSVSIQSVGSTALSGSSAELNAGNDTLIDYTPPPKGAIASFPFTDTVDYTIVDKSGQTDTATLTIVINDNPTANDDAVSTPINESVTISAISNDNDNDSLLLAIRGIGEVVPASAGSATVDDNGTPDNILDDSIIFTPTVGYTGDATIEYTLEDDSYICAADADYQADELVMTDWDYAKDAATGTGVIQYTDEFSPTITHAITMSVSGNGATTYVIEQGMKGDTGPNKAEFIFTKVPRSTTTIDYDFSPALDSRERIIIKDVDLKEKTEIFAYDVDGNALDMSGWNIDRYGFSPTTKAFNSGTSIYVENFALNNLDKPEFVLTPAHGQEVASIKQVSSAKGSGLSRLSFGHAVCDGCTDSGVVTITVFEPVTPPEANPDEVAVCCDEAVTIPVLRNDFDPDRPFNITKENPYRVTIQSVGASSAGETAIAGDRIVFTPTAGFKGTTEINYTIVDEDGRTASSTATVVVNQNPVAANDTAVVNAGSDPVTIDILANDEDDDATNIVSLIDFDATGSLGGTLTRDDNGTPDNMADDKVVYTPPADFNGSETFAYSVEDDETICPTGDLSADRIRFADYTYVTSASFGDGIINYEGDSEPGRAPLTISMILLNASGSNDFRKDFPRVVNNPNQFNVAPGPDSSHEFMNFGTKGGPGRVETFSYLFNGQPLTDDSRIIINDIDSSETMLLTFFDSGNNPVSVSGFSIEEAGVNFNTDVVKAYDGMPNAILLNSIANGDKDNPSIALTPDQEVVRVEVTTGTRMSAGNRLTFAQRECDGCTDEATLTIYSQEAVTSVSKVVTPTSAVAGDTVTYTFEATNPNAFSITADLYDEMTDGRTFVGNSLSVVGSQGTPAVGSTNAYSGTGMLDLKQIEMKANETVTVKISVQIPITLLGPITNTVNIDDGVNEIKSATATLIVGEYLSIQLLPQSYTASSSTPVVIVVVILLTALTTLYFRSSIVLEVQERQTRR